MSLPMFEQASTSNVVPGRVVWITGLAGAGKTSVAESLQKLAGLQNARPILLDGDVLRTVLGGAQSYEPAHRRMLADRYGRLCLALARQGFDVICATISMYHEVHAWNRANLPGYLEVYLRVPRDELIRRNQKGLYVDQDKGPVVGLDISVEEPLTPDLIIENVGTVTPERAAAEIAAHLSSRGVT
jgi:adenylylsulfate kinase-like enzyme